MIEYSLHCTLIDKKLMEQKRNHRIYKIKTESPIMTSTDFKRNIVKSLNGTAKHALIEFQFLTPNDIQFLQISKQIEFTMHGQLFHIQYGKTKAKFKRFKLNDRLKMAFNPIDSTYIKVDRVKPASVQIVQYVKKYHTPIMDATHIEIYKASKLFESQVNAVPESQTLWFTINKRPSEEEIRRCAT